MNTGELHHFGEVVSAYFKTIILILLTYVNEINVIMYYSHLGGDEL